MTDEFSLAGLAAQLEQRIRSHRPLDFDADWTADWVFPHYDGLSLYNIAQSIPQILGVQLPDAHPLHTTVWGDDSPLAEIDRVVLFLSDGLGYRWLQQFIAEDDELRQLVAAVTDGRGPLPLTSISPSTTVVALTTLWTAATPAAHGVVGLSMFIREWSMPIYMLSLSPSIGKHGPGMFEKWGLLEPASFLPVPGLATTLSEHGIQPHLMLQKQLIGSGLSKLLHRGVPKDNRHPTAGFADFWPRIRNLLLQTAGQRAYINIYWPAFDTLAHGYGVDNEFTRMEVKQQFRELASLLANPAIADGRTLFLFTADHGHQDASQWVDFSQLPAGAQIMDTLVHAMTGEPRMAYLTAQHGRRDDLIATLSEHYRDQLAWVSRDDALAAGLFGSTPVDPATHTRLGDILVFPRDRHLVKDHQPMPSLVSWHGGLTDWEMLIPLLWKRL